MRLLQVFLDLGVVKAASNQPLGGIQGVLRVGNSLPLGRHANQALAVGGEGDDRGGGPGSLSILQHLTKQKEPESTSSRHSSGEERRQAHDELLMWCVKYNITTEGTS